MSTLELAINRVETAMETWQKKMEKKAKQAAQEAAADTAGSDDMLKEFKQLQTDYQSLKQAANQVSERLDGAIKGIGDVLDG